MSCSAGAPRSKAPSCLLASGSDFVLSVQGKGVSSHRIKKEKRDKERFVSVFGKDAVEADLF